MYIRINQKKYHVLEVTTKLLCLLALMYILMPQRFASHYQYLSLDEIPEALIYRVIKNLTLQQQHSTSSSDSGNGNGNINGNVNGIVNNITTLDDCNYADLVRENVFMYKRQMRDEVLHSEEILPGGEYMPYKCRARFSTAIIVPYRQREEQLHVFLSYMHNYLRQQRIHYRIFLVEQYDQKPFNRAKLLNIGSIIAAEYGFPCLILNDVDLLPLNLGTLYACARWPRHMCSALDIWRFHLPYRNLMGGVVAILSEQYHLINGMSNLYDGWGGEDDDFYERLKSYNINICRFPPALSEYTMLKHKAEKKNENRVNLLKAGNILRYKIDGLNSLIYYEKERRIHSLFTHILAET